MAMDSTRQCVALHRHPGVNVLPSGSRMAREIGEFDEQAAENFRISLAPRLFRL